MGKFIIKKTPTGYNFHLKAANGETIATSEVYTTLNSCRNGVEAVKKNVLSAGVEDRTLENFETCRHPKFELYKDKAGQFRFRLKAANGEIIAASENYTTKANCQSGIKSVIKNAQDAQIIEQL